MRKILLVALLLAGAAWAQEEAEAEAPRAGKLTGEIVHVAHPELFKLAPVTVKNLERRVRTTGSVTWDVNRAVPVSSIAGGRAVDVRVKLGDEVSRDQVLVVVDSPDVAGVLADLRKAESSLRLARKFHHRASTLYKAEAGPLKDVQQAEEEVNRSTADRQAALERLRLMGADAEGVSRRTAGSEPDAFHKSGTTPLLEVRAPIAGTVVEQNVVKGAAVKSLDSSPNLFTVADLSKVWILCDLYENNLPDVAVGDKAKIALPDRPDSFFGKVAHISRVLDPSTRTCKVRIELDNSDGRLRPGMSASVKFESVATTPSTMVPSTAILRLRDRSWVFHKEAGRGFHKLEVRTGLTLPEGIEEVHGSLMPGDEVVENALQFSNAVDTQEK